jgi:hypothetical protein
LLLAVNGFNPFQSLRITDPSQINLGGGQIGMPETFILQASAKKNPFHSWSQLTPSGIPEDGKHNQGLIV